VVIVCNLRLKSRNIHHKTTAYVIQFDESALPLHLNIKVAFVS